MGGDMLKGLTAALRPILVAMAIVTAAVLSLTARAAPLDEASCEQLKQEEAALDRAGVRAVWSKGPEWARIALGKDKLAQVRRLIEVDEQLAFRCVSRQRLPVQAAAAPGESRPSSLKPKLYRSRNPIRRQRRRPTPLLASSPLRSRSRSNRRSSRKRPCPSSVCQHRQRLPRLARFLRRPHRCRP